MLAARERQPQLQMSIMQHWSSKMLAGGNAKG